MSRAVLQYIAEMSEPVTFSGTAWEFLSASVNVRRLTDLDLFVESLEGEFTPEQLQEAKILSLNDQGESLPSPVVSELKQTFVCLRPSKEECPFDILTRIGSLMNDEPPCFTARLDWHTNLCAEKSKGEILVVTDVRSLALFRLLSLPATLVSGLDDINGEQMRRLCGEPGAVPSQQTDSVQRHNTLTLVGWDVPNMCVEESGCMAAVALRWLGLLNRLTLARRTFGFGSQLHKRFSRLHLPSNYETTS